MERTGADALAKLRALAMHRCEDRIREARERHVKGELPPPPATCGLTGVMRKRHGL
jgi:hypothetical protein